MLATQPEPGSVKKRSAAAPEVVGLQAYWFALEEDRILWSGLSNL